MRIQYVDGPPDFAAPLSHWIRYVPVAHVGVHCDEEEGESAERSMVCIFSLILTAFY